MSELHLLQLLDDRENFLLESRNDGMQRYAASERSFGPKTHSNRLGAWVECDVDVERVLNRVVSTP